MPQIDFQEPRRRRVPLDQFTSNVLSSTAADESVAQPTSYARPRTPPAANDNSRENPYEVPPVNRPDNTGIGGYGGPSGGTPPPPVVPPAVTQRQTQAPMGVDAGKWASGHLSPKYAFMEASQRYDQRTPEGRAQTLAELQQKYPQWFTGWTIEGDKLRHASGSLHGDFDGYNEFDAWVGSGVGQWQPAWQPTQRNGQAYVDPGQPQAPATGASASGAGGGGASNNGIPDTLNQFQSLFGGGGDFSLGASQFDDPDTARLLQFVNQRVQELTRGVDDPQLGRYISELGAAGDRLKAPINDPTIDQALEALNVRSGELRTPVNDLNTANAIKTLTDLAAKLNAPINDPTVTAALDAIRGRSASLNTPLQRTSEGQRLEQMITEAIPKLSGDPMSDTTFAQYRNRALDNLERARQGEIQATIRRMEGMGHAPSSGTIQEAINQVNQRYSAARAEAERELSIFATEEANRRRQEAFGLATQSRDIASQEQGINEQRLNQALSVLMQAPELTRSIRGEEVSRATTGAGMATQAAGLSTAARAENEGRLNQALDLVLQRPDIARSARSEQDARTLQGVNLFGEAANQNAMIRRERDANMDKALSLVSLPVDLTDRRMQSALQVLGLGGSSSPMSIFNSLAQLAGQNQAFQQSNNANNANFWAQLGQMMAASGGE